MAIENIGDVQKPARYEFLDCDLSRRFLCFQLENAIFILLLIYAIVQFDTRTMPYIPMMSINSNTLLLILMCKSYVHFF